jgi:hypothetical protein
VNDVGTSGPGIFSNDTASDVRGTFRDLIGEGKTVEEATRQLVEEFETDDPDDGPLFWLGLAATQWQLGRLLPDVQQRAIAIIDEGADLANWEADASAADVRKRRVALHKLREQLLTAPPPPKRIPKPFIQETPYMRGDVVAFRLRSGRFALLRITEVQTDTGGSAPVVEVLRWTGDGLPSAAEIQVIPTWTPEPGVYHLQIGKRDISSRPLTRNLLFRWSKRDDPSPRLTLLAQGVPIPEWPPANDYTEPNRAVGVRFWRDFDNYLEVVFGLS